MKEIGRYYRFYLKPPKDIAENFQQRGIALDYLYGGCLPEEWANVQQEFEVISKHPQEPHLCVGFETRF